jgi:antitoxin component YwqK of YwqJK toxin-antitoxin module
MAFYPSGKLFSKGEFKNSQFDGEWLIYFENGQIKQKGNYSLGKSVGRWQYFHPNGNPWKIGSYIDDKEEGLWYVYTENGELQACLLYKNAARSHLGCIFVNKKANLVYIDGDNVIQLSDLILQNL